MRLTFKKLTAITTLKDKNPPFFLSYSRQRPRRASWSNRCRVDLCRPHICCNPSLLTQFSVGSHKVKSCQHIPRMKESLETMVQMAAMLTRSTVSKGSRAPGPCQASWYSPFQIRTLQDHWGIPCADRTAENRTNRKSVFLIMFLLIAKIVIDIT